MTMSDAVTTQADATQTATSSEPVKEGATEAVAKEGILSAKAEDAPKSSEPVKTGEKVEPPTEQKQEVKYDLKLPEGSSLGKEHVDAVVELAKAKKYSPEVAQDILAQKSEAVASFAKLQKEQVDTQSHKWFEELQKDKEFGGDKFQKHATMAQSWAKKNLPAELIDLIVDAGVENYPPLVKWMVQRATQEGNDTFVHAKQTGVEKRPAWQNMYGETTPSE
jgi:hypothetical protein